MMETGGVAPIMGELYQKLLPTTALVHPLVYSYLYQQIIGAFPRRSTGDHGIVEWGK